MSYSPEVCTISLALCQHPDRIEEQIAHLVSEDLKRELQSTIDRITITYVKKLRDPVRLREPT